MFIWYPDFCPVRPQCAIEIDKTSPDRWLIPKSIIRLCSHHQSVKDLGLMDDTAIFGAVYKSSQLKEIARWTVKVSLGLDKRHPGVPYFVDASGDITVTTDPALIVWTLEDGTEGPLPRITTGDRNRARSDAEAALIEAGQQSGTGVSNITVD